MTSLHQFLYTLPAPQELHECITEIARASKYTKHAIETESTKKSGNTNVQGEDQLALDEKCDQIFCSVLSESNIIFSFASEEQEKSVHINDNGLYSVAFDPLDGSSLLDTNGCVGSIFGVWEEKKFLGNTGKELKAAGYFQYGPRTTFILAIGGQTHEFTLSSIGEYHLSQKNICIQDTAQIFSFGNLRAVSERAEYKNALEYFLQKQYTLRYAGGMVPDINSILCKKNGVFTYPSCNKHTSGKLRLLYECAPMAYIIENAGGIAVTESGENILALPINSLHQRTSILLGSKSTVNDIVEILNP